MKLKKIKIKPKKTNVTKIKEEKTKIPKIIEKKQKKTKRKINYKKIILSTILIGGITAITAFLVLALYIIVTAPDFNENLLFEKEATIIYDVNGSEIARIGKDNVELVTYDELPQVLIDAIVATEDSRFFQHTGLDAPRFVIATAGNLLGNEDAGGASTLSMQVIKNTYTSSDASGFSGIVRKLTDVYMSIFKLENAYTKEEIIEFYVNSQWLANDGNTNYTSITGVEQASHYFFGKSVSELSLAEATIIAGMFQNPVAHNPYDYPESARSRQKTVLTLMVRHGYITEAEMDAVLEIPIESLLVEQEGNTNNYLQAAIDYALDEVIDKTTTDENPNGINPYTTPMEIYTTFDPEVQQVLNDVETGESYEIPEARGPLQFGIAVTSMTDGSIVGLSAGIDYVAKGDNYALMRQQPGSTVKPIFDYAPYIEYLNGSPGTIFLDEPHTYTNGGSVRNYDNKFKGYITMQDALIDSRNIPALKAFQAVNEYDSSLIGEFVNGLGIDYGTTLYESAAIGGFDGVSPLELSAAYAAFGRDGYYIEPYSVTKIHLIEEDKTIEYKYTKEKAMEESTADLVNQMLVAAGDANVAGFKVSGTDIGAKTGTTTIDADAAEILNVPENTIPDSWVASYNPQYSIATWLGYKAITEDYYLTSSLAAPIRNAISKAVGSELYDKNQTFDKMSGVTSVVVEKETIPLMLASDGTPDNMKYSATFIAGTEPTEVSARYEILNNVTNLKASSSGAVITLNWDAIATPDALNQEVLIDYFNESYGTSATKYYESRLAYNTSSIGSITYDIYLDVNGNLIHLGTTATTSFNYDTTTNVLADGNYNFVIISNYSIYKGSQSSGAQTEIKVSISTTPTPEPTPEEDDEDGETTPDNPNDNNSDTNVTP